jgi:putative methyltransferase (TIGR04325 family)
MKSLIKTLTRELAPPIFLKIYQEKIIKYGFFGNYKSWQEAYKNSTGYDADIILEKVKQSLLKVKKGESAYARDSVNFDKIEYSFPLLTSLLRIAIENSCDLNILDFGGSLGTSYFQCKFFLNELRSLQWSIVEQKNFVDCGNQFFEDDSLKFFYDIDTCLSVRKPDVILLSGVIQCLENPYEFMNTVINYEFKHILIDRTAFTMKGDDRLTVQKVSPEIYPASYPSWFLNLEHFLSLFLGKYDLIFEFDSQDCVNIPSKFKGFYFKKK